MSSILRAQDIYNYVDKHVIGQERAKIVVSNAVFLHFVRFFHAFNYPEIPLSKTNALLHGPSGSGKTLIVRKASEALRELTNYDVAPVLEIDCTTLAAVGWEGESILDYMSAHYEEYEKNQATFNSSIIVFDEMDKLCLSQISKGGSDHNRNTQYGLLKAVEGAELQHTKGRKSYKMNTDKMLFIFAGNFAQLRHARDKANRPMGFTQDKSEILIDAHRELERAGMVTQLVGRIGAIAELEPLSKKDLRKVFDHAQNNIHFQYKHLWEYMGYDLKISEYKIKKIINECYDKKVGARGLLSALERELEDEIIELEFKL